MVKKQVLQNKKCVDMNKEFGLRMLEEGLYQVEDEAGNSLSIVIKK
jgi:hypothetical protein